MLGMDEEGGRGNCECKATEARCAIPDCECSKYCKSYLPLYERIKDGGKFCWLTISPKPIQIETDFDKFTLWMNDFKDLKSCTDKLILVVEYTQKMIMHFHMMIRLKDKIKFKKAFIQRWYYSANIEPIYGKEPKNGIHYLFKSVEETQDLLEFKAHYTLEDIFCFCIHNRDLKSQLFGLITESEYD